MLTYSEIFRIQKIVDNLNTVVKIVEESRKRELDSLELEKIDNLFENCTEEFYLIEERYVRFKCS